MSPDVSQGQIPEIATVEQDPTGIQVQVTGQKIRDCGLSPPLSEESSRSGASRPTANNGDFELRAQWLVPHAAFRLTLHSRLPDIPAVHGPAVEELLGRHDPVLLEHDAVLHHEPDVT